VRSLLNIYIRSRTVEINAHVLTRCKHDDLLLEFRDAVIPVLGDCSRGGQLETRTKFFGHLGLGFSGLMASISNAVTSSRPTLGNCDNGCAVITDTRESRKFSTLSD